MISDIMNDYMKKNDIGFNELVRRLDASPSHVAKIQRGEANLTLSSLAHLLALMDKDPQDVFKKKR
jgi:plasmid maintenance system antidote protein VapI